ncbi:MAG: type VI secretion system protein TssL, long form [Rhodospirillales bacterium]
MDGARRRRQEGAPSWMVTFADLMALLLALFIMLLSFSDIDSTSFKKNAGPISDAFGILKDDPVADPTQAVTAPSIDIRPIKTEEPTAPGMTVVQQLEFIREFREALQGELDANLIELVERDGRVIIRFPDNTAFAAGSGEVEPRFLPVLDKISKVLERSHGQIMVSGHTDNIPISTARYRSNWDLSAARAVSVVHRLLSTGDIPADRITAQGFADSRPIAANATPDGRALNRRVEIWVGQP